MDEQAELHICIAQCEKYSLVSHRPYVVHMAG